MPSETGHAINIQQFKLLIDVISTFDSYAPSNEDLTILKMTAAWTTVTGLQDDFLEGLENAKDPINAREILFSTLGTFITRTVGYFNSTKASDEIKKDIKGLANKIRGFNLKLRKLEDGKPDPDAISKSHMSFVQRAGNFEQLIYLYKSSSFYSPNETDLKNDALATKLTSLRDANDGIGAIIAPVMELRNKRNAGIYAKDTGLLDIAKDCKEYVKGLFGANSPQFKEVAGIKFRRYKI